METILLALVALAGAAVLGFAAHKLGEAHERLELVRHQRRRDKALR